MAGLLDMNPQQYGLLMAGLGMMQNSRGRSLGEAMGAGSAQGVDAMTAMQRNQQLQELRDMQMQQAQLEMKRKQDQDARESTFRSSMQNIDPADSNALSKALMDAGLYEDAIRLRSQKASRDGVPTGFVANPDGTIAPMPISGGGNYMDYQVQLAGQKAQMPSFGEAERLRLAYDANAREREKYQLDMVQKDRQLSNAEFQNNLANWKLLNPNYDKNIGQIEASRAGYEKLKNGLDSYISALEKYDQIDRHNPLKNSDLQTAYQNATFAIRGEDLMNSGVLNPGEIPLLSKVLSDPTSVSSLSGWRDKNELKAQREQLLNLARKNVNAKVKELLPASAPPSRNGDMLDLNQYYIPETVDGWEKVQNVDAEINKLRAEGDHKTANALEQMKKRDESSGKVSGKVSDEELLKKYLGK